MCSTREARLARLRAAIDEVALAAQADPAGHASPEELAERLAGLWAMIADLDPGLAARLRGYCPDTSLRGRTQPGREPPGLARRGPGCQAHGAPGTQPAATGPRGPGARAPGQIPRATAKSAEGRRAWS